MVEGESTYYGYLEPSPRHLRGVLRWISEHNHLGVVHDGVLNGTEIEQLSDSAMGKRVHSRNGMSPSLLIVLESLFLYQIPLVLYLQVSLVSFKNDLNISPHVIPHFVVWSVSSFF